MASYPSQDYGPNVQFQPPGGPQGYSQPHPNAPPPTSGPPPIPNYFQSTQGQYPAAAYPPGSYPASAYPQAGYPQAGYPQAGYPQAGYPQAGYTAGYPNQGMPISGSTLPHFQSNISDVSEINDQNEGLTNWKGFTDKAIRRTFIRKVYAILMTQLAFTVGMIALFVFQADVNLFVKRNYGIYIAAYIAFFILYFMLLCCGKLRRNYPTNYILLFLFTLVLSYVTAAISSYHDTKAVMIAMGICASCCLAITLFSFQTKYDFTTCGGCLFILSWVLFMFGIIAIVTFRTVPILHTVFAAFGALLFMVFLAYDTQMLMGGKKYQIGAEEHIFAALQLYMDVVQIFLFILALMGGGKK